MNVVRNAAWAVLARILAIPFVAAWLIRRAQRTPYLHLEGYMDRWWLFNPYDPENREAKSAWWKFSARVHHIKRADRDRHLHDHPWDYRTIVLKGYYVEERENGVAHIRMAGETAALGFGEFHRIAQVSQGGVWTLFITWGYQGTWGFKVKGEKVPHRVYLGGKQ